MQDFTAQVRKLTVRSFMVGVGIGWGDEFVVGGVAERDGGAGCQIFSMLNITIWGGIAFTC